MTDRIRTLTVALDHDYRDDDAQAILDAIRMVRGVAAVEAEVAGVEVMTAIHGVLLVPEEGDPHELLREGPCGARPPMAYRFRKEDTTWRPDPGRWGQRALVLAWDGEPVVEGLDRFRRATGAMWPESYISERWWDRLSAGMAGWGTIILLDADGREVTP